MDTTGTVAATATRRIRASAGRVFDALLDPALARQWFGPGMGEMTRVEIDARVGGTFWLVQRRGDVDAVHTGEYLELDRPRRLVFSWQNPPETDVSRVVIDIAPHLEGCEVTLTHEIPMRWADYKDQAAAAWLTMADTLAGLLESPVAGR